MALVSAPAAAVSTAPAPEPLGQVNDTTVVESGCANANIGWNGFEANGANFGPVAVAVNPSSNRLWVTDFRNSENAGSVGRLYSWPSFRTRDCKAAPDITLSGLNQPEALTFDSNGNLYMAETGNSIIYGWTPQNQTPQSPPTKNNAFIQLQTWNNNQDNMQFPRGLAFGPDGKLYVADDFHHRVLAFDVAANNTTPVSAITNGVCHPKAVAFMGSSLFVANYSPQFGDCQNPPPDVVRYDGTLGANSQPAASFTAPAAIDLGVSGSTLFVSATEDAAAGDRRLTRFEGANQGTGARPAGTNTPAVARNGFRPYTLKPPEFGLASTPDGTMLLADSGAFRVVEFSPAKSNTTTTVTSSKSPSAVNEQVTFTATVRSAVQGDGIPTGSVKWTVDGADAGTGSLDANGTARLQRAFADAATHSVKADYLGDNGVNAFDGFNASSGTMSQSVSGAATTTTVATGPAITLSRQTASPGDSLTIAGTGFPGGTTLTVTMASTPITLGSVTTTSAGSFASTVTIPTNADPGVHTITATGPGGTPSASASLVVAASTVTTPAANTPAASAAPTASPGTLAVTGFRPLTWLLGAMAALLLGMGLVVASEI